MIMCIITVTSSVVCGQLVPCITAHCGAKCDDLVIANYWVRKKIYKCNNSYQIISRHTVVCRAAQENGARANGSEYINRNNKVAIFTHS